MADIEFRIGPVHEIRANLQFAELGMQHIATLFFIGDDSIVEFSFSVDAPKPNDGDILDVLDVIQATAVPCNQIGDILPEALAERKRVGSPLKALEGILWMAEEWFKHSGSSTMSPEAYSNKIDAARRALGLPVEAVTPMTTLTDSQGKAGAHTPGPWFAVNDGTADEPMMTVKAARIAGRPPRHCVAIVATGDSPQEMENANARLIAAAPDLLEALDGMMPVNGPSGPDADGYIRITCIAEDIERALAALRKATGAA